MKISALSGAVLAVSLVVAGLWGISAAPSLVERAARPLPALWAVRSIAAAALVAAQLLGLTWVSDLFYARDRLADVLRLTGGLACAASLVGAIALAVSSQ